MKYYTDGFLNGTNPCPIGGGYTIVSQDNELIHLHRIDGQLTNNEAEVRGIIHAIQIAGIDDTVSTDSMIALNWLIRGKSKARPELDEALAKANKERTIKNIRLIWEGRDNNLAGHYNDWMP